MYWQPPLNSEFLLSMGIKCFEELSCVTVKDCFGLLLREGLHHASVGFRLWMDGPFQNACLGPGYALLIRYVEDVKTNGNAPDHLSL